MKYVMEEIWVINRAYVLTNQTAYPSSSDSTISDDAHLEPERVTSVVLSGYDSPDGDIKDVALIGFQAHKESAG